MATLTINKKNIHNETKKVNNLISKKILKVQKITGNMSGIVEKSIQGNKCRLLFYYNL